MSGNFAFASRYDYTPPGLADLDLKPAFPTLTATDPNTCPWPLLRQHTPHILRIDSRSSRPMIGVLSHEEAVLLFNLASQFRGARGLEIGCHLAWSTAHLLAAGLTLDVIDPQLGEEAH